MDQLKRDFSIVYVCNNCTSMAAPPTHCGKAMQVEVQNGKNFWVCWKGEHPPCCGRKSMVLLDVCCDKQELNTHIQQMLT